MAKYVSLLLIWIFAAGIAYADKTDARGTEIQFEIAGMENGWCRIIGMLGSQNYLLDTIEAKNGLATLKRDVSISPGLYYFVLPDKKTFLQFLLDSDQYFKLKTDRKNLVQGMVVENSLDNDLFYQNLKFEETFRTKFDSVEKALKAISGSSPDKAYLENQKKKLLQLRKDHLEGFSKDHPGSFFTVFKIAGQNPNLQYPKLPNGKLDTLKQLDLYRKAYWANTSLSDERLLRTPVIFNKLKTFITQLTPQSADSVIKYSDLVIRKSQSCKECFKFITNWIAIQYEKPKFMGGDAILVHLVDTWFTDELAFWYEEKPEELKKIRKKVREMRPSLIGKTGQDLLCTNLEGNKESFYSLGTPIKLLFMYSYSCSHCKKRAPVLVEVMKEWKDKGVDVYALCLDPEEDMWKEFVKKHGMEGFHNVFDPDLASRYYWKYHVDITPELYMLDENNIIVAKDLHPNQLPKMLKKHLKP